MPIPAAPQIHPAGRVIQFCQGRARRLRQCRDAPARRRGDRLRAVPRGQVPGAPAAQQEAGNAGLLRRQLQAPARRQCHSAEFADAGADGAAAQRFLQRPAHLRVAPGGDQDQPSQIDTVRGEAGGVEIVILGHPQHPARPHTGLRRPSLQYQGNKARGSGTLLLVATLAGDLMHRGGRYAGRAKRRVDIPHPHAQQGGLLRRPLFRRGGFDRRNTALQFAKVQSRCHVRAIKGNPYVLFLFQLRGCVNGSVRCHRFARISFKII